MIAAQPGGSLLRTDLLDIRHVAGDAALDDELVVDLDLGEQLLHLDGEILSVLLRIFLLDPDPRPAEILVEGVAEQHQKEHAHHQEGAP